MAAPEEIDITNAGSLRAALLEAAVRGRGTFVVDMSLTRFCDSSGLQALVAAHRRARAEDGEVLLVIPDTAVLRVFAITGMDRVIPNFASLAEALAQVPAARRGRRGPQLAAMAGTRAGSWLTPEKGRDDAAISSAPPR